MKSPVTSNPTLTPCKQCGKPLGLLPPRAKHKVFCSSACRTAWHADHMRQARKVLEEIESGAAQIVAVPTGKERK